MSSEEQKQNVHKLPKLYKIAYQVLGHQEKWDLEFKKIVIELATHNHVEIILLTDKAATELDAIPVGLISSQKWRKATEGTYVNSGRDFLVHNMTMIMDAIIFLGIKQFKL